MDIIQIVCYTTTKSIKQHVYHKNHEFLVWSKQLLTITLEEQVPGTLAEISKWRNERHSLLPYNKRYK